MGKLEDMELHAHWPHRRERQEKAGAAAARVEADKLRVAGTQLEAADLYLAAAVNLEVEDVEVRHMLDDLRRRLLWVRDRIERPRVVS